MQKTSWLVASIVTDVIMSGLLVGIITIAARAGIPSNCGGLTKNPPLDVKEPPKEPYTTHGFSNQSDGKKGKLDNLCALERGYYFIAVAIMFSYILTIVLTVLAIARDAYARRFKADYRLLYRGGGTAAERALFFGNSTYELDESDKPSDDPRLQTPRSSPTAAGALQGQPPQAPPSEGVMSARQSLRVAPAPGPPMHHQQQLAAGGGLHIQAPPPPQQQQRHQQAFAQSPQATSPATMHFIPSPTSPIRHHHNHHHHQQGPPPPIPPRIPTPPSGSMSPPPSKPLVLVPGLASDESQSDAAAAAMITDGARYRDHHQHHHHAGGSSSSSSSAYGPHHQAGLLPPAYTPSTQADMPGHGAGESNEMRLSGYVKGETRAQAMKDSSGRGPGL
ncbi:uncharacterized protein E0L32_011442 [Thyridium curvatum]|uniref:Uncharacterized protein n=1 Tax=Thyridium curvatum TaxID=1093900 RepID=A0A507BQ24_9PEZI|nr:uncharacterized protein E0L32_011442 [Thyridium curvatum]TPX18890.1 hypothetical protein E0L32_011442 [Thyridium curvatum]